MHRVARMKIQRVKQALQSDRGSSNQTNPLHTPSLTPVRTLSPALCRFSLPPSLSLLFVSLLLLLVSSSSIQPAADSNSCCFNICCTCLSLLPSLLLSRILLSRFLVSLLYSDPLFPCSSPRTPRDCCSQHLPNKTTRDCVQFYYLNKKASMCLAPYQKPPVKQSTF